MPTGLTCPDLIVLSTMKMPSPKPETPLPLKVELRKATPVSCENWAKSPLLRFPPKLSPVVIGLPSTSIAPRCESWMTKSLTVPAMNTPSLLLSAMMSPFRITSVAVASISATPLEKFPTACESCSVKPVLNGVMPTGLTCPDLIVLLSNKMPAPAFWLMVPFWLRTNRGRRRR